jgi:hypothetical protein
LRHSRRATNKPCRSFCAASSRPPTKSRPRADLAAQRSPIITRNAGRFPLYSIHKAAGSGRLVVPIARQLTLN